MTKANNLPYYPRFIFNFSDDRAFSTADLDFFKDIKNADDEHGYDIEQFFPGQSIKMTWSNEEGGVDVKLHKVDRIEIHQIKHDLDEPTYGMNMNDVRAVDGKTKKHMMEIYVFLTALK